MLSGLCGNQAEYCIPKRLLSAHACGKIRDRGIFLLTYAAVPPRRQYRQRWIVRSATALALFSISLSARIPFCTDHVFTYDAADYWRAIQVGFWAQYVGSDSISFSRFYRRYQSDPVFQQHPWGPLYNEADGSALRHFHVPLAFYLPAIANDWGLGRKSQLLIVAAESSITVAVTYLILVGLTASELIAVLISLCLCFSPVLILAGTSLSPHPVFSLTAMVAVFALVRWLQTGQRGWFALLLAGCALSIAALELSPLLIATVLATFALELWWWRNDPGYLWNAGKMLTAGAAGVLGLLFVIWPGGFLRGGYLMSYGTFVFQGVFRSSLYFRDRNLVSSVAKLGHGWPLGITFILLLATAVFATVRSRRNPALAAFTIFAVLLFGQGLANGFRNPTYASHAVFIISISAGLGLNELLRNRHRAERWVARAAFGFLGILTAAELAGVLAAQPEETVHDPQRIEGAITEIRKHYPAGTGFVVTQDPQAFILNAPDYRFAGAAAVDSALPNAWSPTSRYHLLVDREEKAQPHGIALCGDGLAQYGFAISCNELAGPAAASGR